MQSQAIKDFIELDEQIQKINQRLIILIKDKSIPLDERWNLFVNYGNRLGKANNFPKYDILDLLDLYNPPDRYKTYTYVEDIEFIKDMFDLDEEGFSGYDIEDSLLKLENIGIKFINKEDWDIKIKKFIDKLKEEVLEKGKYSYVYDW